MGGKNASATKRSKTVTTEEVAGSSAASTSTAEVAAGPPIAKREWAENWSKSEQLALVNAVNPVYDQLFGKHSTTLDEAKKHELWNSVANTVNPLE